MTEKLYDKDSHLHTFQAQVLSCEPCKNGFQVTLNATAFFPEGGGQAGDRGRLGSAHVLDVHEKQGIIFHTTDAPLTPGERIEGVIDWALRFDRMQQHSGEHLVSGLVHQRFGYDNVGFHLGDQEVTLDFNGPLTWEDLMDIEWSANQAVAANFPVKISYPSREELASLTYRSKIEIQGQVRLVAFPGYDICACCAPHVDHTGEIGLIKITHVQSHRGGVRVNILCGLRALQDYREKAASVKAISVLLSAKEALVSQAVTRLKEEQFTTRGRYMALQEQLLQKELEALPKDSQNVSYFFADLDANILREFVNQLMTRCRGYCAAFLGNDEMGYRYIIGSSTPDIRPLGKALKEALKGQGGGKPEMIQGSLPASKSQILEFLKDF